MKKVKNALVIGLGISGRAAAQLLIKEGTQVLGVDRNAELLFANDAIMELRALGMKTQLDSEPLDIKVFDLVVVSPGVPESHIYYEQARAGGIEVIGEIELACRYIKNPVLAITGTNGKTTVTLLTTHVLNQAGKEAKALGNVGIPLAAELTKITNSKTILVLELSSFQLDTLQSRVIDAGVILNITPDHLDRYHSMKAYAFSKARMKDCLKPNGVLYVEDKAYQEWQFLFDGTPVRTYGYHRSCYLSTDLESIFVKEKIDYLCPEQYRGRRSHDIENLLASYALCREVGVTAEQFWSAVQTFKKPSHRIEYVDQVNGVAFYDDSKGTNLDAVIRAVDSLQGKIILIAGGVDKGSPYEPWIEAFHGKVKEVCAIGEAAEKIKRELHPKISVEQFSNLEAAVHYAAKVAKPGDTVLLSPGCSSFDMFRDYAHRGDEFKRIVRTIVQLKEKEG